MTSLLRIAAAIALAYAGLKNFRYRIRVRDYVREVANNDFIQNMETYFSTGNFLPTNECWAIPIFLVIQGRALADEMRTEADKCCQQLKHEMGEVAKTAQVTRPDAYGPPGPRDTTVDRRRIRVTFKDPGGGIPQ